MPTYTATGPTTFQNQADNSIVNTASTPLAAVDFPSSRTTKIMPIGDSITRGQGGEGYGGYRGYLWEKLWKAGFKFDFTGPYNQPPDMTWPATGPWAFNGTAEYYGYGGYSVKDLRNLSAQNPAGVSSPTWNSTGKGAKEHVAQYLPDVILLHAGTNGISQLSTATHTADMNGLLDDIYSSKPDVVIYLAKIIGESDYKDVVVAYNNALATIATERRAAGKRVILVNQQDGITGGWIRDATHPNGLYYDDIHPNTYGYAQMADIWFNAILNAPTGLGA